MKSDKQRGQEKRGVKASSTAEVRPEPSQGDYRDSAEYWRNRYYGSKASYEARIGSLEETLRVTRELLTEKTSQQVAPVINVTQTANPSDSRKLKKGLLMATSVAVGLSLVQLLGMLFRA